VPTVSALDLDQDPSLAVPPADAGKSPFEDYVFNAENQPHLTITPECSMWLLAALGVAAENREDPAHV
jgi:hypothetical protein